MTVSASQAVTGAVEPIASLAHQLDLQIAAQRLLIGRVGQRRSFKAKLDHAKIALIRQVKRAVGVVKKIGIVRAVGFQGALDPFAASPVLRRSIDRNVHAPDRPQRQAVKFDVDVYRLIDSESSRDDLLACK